ncbi:dipeptidase [Psychrosphaera saromensis]|uniref:Dipeptidase n=1 Tax=Psychrosphaera saromensis TaxID=716813 RepID=A0A2S7USA2_9GAMM|nr:dipeptidase [Psychrosphaera saromensis]PQJ52807.1 dipeptidase [Psychrosphaera saromensis]GHB71414.1 dipeptidase [Psychrosphaera saromensis]GLQ13307.1 dipeptidase [Psychrosphaera saromensis]
MNIFLKASVILVVGFVTTVNAAKPATNLSAELSSKIIETVSVQKTDKFDDFLASLLSCKLSADEKPLIATIKKFRKKQTLEGAELHQLQRLLGLYTRIKYGQEAMDTLAKLVAIQTFRAKDIEQHDNPEFHKMADAIEHLAKDFNLAFRNIDNRVFEVSLKGSSDEVVGIHAHADVVQVNPSLWVLEDGTKLNPFKLTLIGDRMYGRGTEDDKNGIVVSMYAMKVIQEENLPLLRNFNLLIDTTEETSSTAIPYYFERNPTPNYNLALDGGYPVVIAEKGFGIIMADFPVRESATTQTTDAEIVDVSGGLAINQIPAASVATIKTANPSDLANKLNTLGAAFVAKNKANFSINALVNAQDVMLTVKGVSAHSSEPESGVNPVSRMFSFINYVQQQKVASFKQNHITDAASYIAANWGLGYLGEILDIGFTHDFMGPLTNAVTSVTLDDKSLQVGVNLRIPVGRELDKYQQEILAKLTKWQQANKVDVGYKVYMKEPMYRNPKGQWVNALLDVASENLSMPREFGSSSGGTSVHNLPNGVQFGLAMPNQKYTGHNANEFKRVDQFLLDLQIITEMIARIGQMPSLK